MSDVFLAFWEVVGVGELFLCGTHSDSDDLPGRATAVSFTPVWKITRQMCCSSKMTRLHFRLALSENLFTYIFRGPGLGMVDQFRGLRTRPTLRHLISSHGNTLRTLFTTFMRPSLMN